MRNETPEINVGALSEALNDKADRSELQKITQELNTKADLDMNNIPSATLSAKIAPLLENLGGSGGIAEQGERDTGGYCLWDNGLLVQWFFPPSSGQTTQTISLWKAYPNTKYSILAPSVSKADVMYLVAVKQATTDKITLWVSSLANAAPVDTPVHVCTLGFTSI